MFNLLFCDNAGGDRTPPFAHQPCYNRHRALIRAAGPNMIIAFKEGLTMRRQLATCVGFLGVSLSLAGSAAVQALPASAAVQHVLLLSIDGAHALDVANYVRLNPQSALAELSGMSI